MAAFRDLRFGALQVQRLGYTGLGFMGLGFRV